MKRSAISSSTKDLLDSTSGNTPSGQIASTPRYGGEVLFQSTSDFQSLSLLGNESWKAADDRNSAPSSKKSQANWLDGSVAIKIFIVILSGCLSSVPFEMMIRLDIGSGMFSAFFLHIYTVLIGLPRAYNDGYLISSKLPYSWHVMLVGLSFLFIVFKTAAIENMPMPLFIVGSNLQLAAGVVIGYFIDGQRYSIGQLFAVLCVTCGCIIVTLNGDSFLSGLGFIHTLFGLFCITTAVSILSFLVSASNIAVKKFDAGTLEQMFRQHLFSLPLFALEWASIGPRFHKWFESQSLFSVYGFTVPILYVLLLCSTVFAQLNRYMSTNLAIEVGPLESQIVCAATKTIVLLVSLLYFNAPPYPSIRVWCGVIIQLCGSLLYAKLTTPSGEQSKEALGIKIQKSATDDDTDEDSNGKSVKFSGGSRSPVKPEFRRASSLESAKLLTPSSSV